MNTIGAAVRICGEVWSAEDVTISGRVEGPITCEGVVVTIAAGAEIAGDVVARDITVFGTVTGRLLATEAVDLRPGSVVSGQVLSPQFILHDGALFHGRVEPQHLEAALRVREYQRRKDATAAAAQAPVPGSGAARGAAS